MVPLEILGIVMPAMQSMRGRSILLRLITAWLAPHERRA